MATLVYLLRHGTTDWTAALRLAGRLPGISLNAQGRMESAAVAARLAAVPLRRIVTSPLERALETAGQIAEATGLPVERDEAFTERAFPPAWEGMPSPEIRARFPAGVRAHAAGQAVPGMEPLPAMTERVMAGLRRLAREHADEAVLVVSHGDPIRAAIAHIVGVPAPSLRAIPVDPASLSRVRQRNDVFAVDYLNSRLHLPDASPEEW